MFSFEQLWRSREPCARRRTRGQPPPRRRAPPRPHGDELFGSRLVRRAGDRELPLCRQAVGDERKRLQRLRRGCRRRRRAPVASGLDDVPSWTTACVVARLDEPRPGHATLSASTRRKTAPEFPGVEAARQTLDEPIARPGRQSGAGARGHPEDVRPAALAPRGPAVRRGPARQAPSHRRRRARPPRAPDERRAHPPWSPARRPCKTPAFRLRLKDGGELILTEGGPKKRARVGVYRPDQLEAELAHLGPEAVDHGRGAGGDRPPRGAAPASVPPRPAGARRHRACVVERDPEPREALPVRTRRPSSDEEVERLAATIRELMAEGLELRLAGAADKKAYKVHNRLGEPCSNCATPIARVDFEEHTIFYCPECQTDGRVLKDRRLVPASCADGPAATTVSATTTSGSNCVPAQSSSSASASAERAARYGRSVVIASSLRVDALVENLLTGSVLVVPVGVHGREGLHPSPGPPPADARRSARTASWRSRSASVPSASAPRGRSTTSTSIRSEQRSVRRPSCLRRQPDHQGLPRPLRARLERADEKRGRGCREPRASSPSTTGWAERESGERRLGSVDPEVDAVVTTEAGNRTSQLRWPGPSARHRRARGRLARRRLPCSSSRPAPHASSSESRSTRTGSYLPDSILATSRSRSTSSSIWADAAPINSTCAARAPEGSCSSVRAKPNGRQRRGCRGSDRRRARRIGVRSSYRWLLRSPVERRPTGTTGTVDMQASVPEVQLGLSRAGVTGVQKRRPDAARRPRRSRLRRDRLLRRPRPGAQGRAHVALPELFEEAIDEFVIGEDAFVERLAEHIARHIVERQDALREGRKIAARYLIERTTSVTRLRTQELVTLVASRSRGRRARRRGGSSGSRRRDQRAPLRAGARPRPGSRAARRGRFEDADVARILELVPLATHNQRGRGTLYSAPTSGSTRRTSSSWSRAL